ncbi:SEC, partial [Symbiodinium microadriaticum]
FAFHDRSKFEIYCYSLTPSDCSEWRVRIEQGVDAIKDISQMHFSDAVNQIRADRVHILINLNGYTKGSKNEIFALRPAPLQISLMGFCGTMGTPFMNYMIADPTVIPPVFREYYDEKIISMPHTFFVNDHRQSSRFILDNSKAVKRAQYGIDEDKFVFCCFNKLSKIEPELFDTWVRILKRVPNSVLWLLRFPPVGEENIFNEARKRGLRHDQIVFSDIVPKIEHQSRCVLADLCLDTTGYNSHTTSCDMLWAGTPLVTLPGDRMASRVAASMLTSCGLQELICPTLAAYEELAVSLAQDTDKLYSMRQHLERCRENCAAFDTPRWVRNMEKGLLAAWERHENGLSPGDILVPDIDPVFEVKEEELLGFSAPPPGGDDEDAYADDFGGV